MSIGLTTAAMLLPALLIAPLFLRHRRRLAALPLEGRRAAGLRLAAGTGAAYLGATVLLIGFVFKPLATSRIIQQQSRCQSRLSMLHRAIVAYTEDWDDRLPPAAHWSECILVYLGPGDHPQVFRCPAAAGPYGFGFNRHLDRVSLFDVPWPQEIVLFADVETGARSGLVDADSVARRHGHLFNVVLMDGRTRWMNPRLEGGLGWKPRKGFEHPAEP